MAESTIPGPKPRKNIFGFFDETGYLRNPETDRMFGLGILTAHHPSSLHRAIIKYKNSKNYHEELKFTYASKYNLPLYKGFIDLFFNESDLTFHSLLFDKAKLDISKHFAGDFDRAYNSFTAELISRTIDTSDYITILADDVETKKNNNFEKDIKEKIKAKCRRNALFGICRLESHAVSEIQLTDVLLGTVAYAYKLKYKFVSPGKNSAKLQLVKHLQKRLDIDILTKDVNRNMKRGLKFHIDEFFEKK